MHASAATTGIVVSLLAVCGLLALLAQLKWTAAANLAVAATWHGATLFDRSPPVAAFGLLAGSWCVPTMILWLFMAQLDAPRSRRVNWVGPAVVGLGVLSTCRTLFFDPFLDPKCPAGRCGRHNPVLLHPSPPIAQLMQTAVAAATLSLAIVLAGSCLRRPLARTRVSFGHRFATLCSAVMLLLWSVVWLASRPIPMPEYPGKVLVALRDVIGLCFGAATVFVAASPMVTWFRVHRLGARLASAAEDRPLRDRLADALGDDRLSVAYVDDDGRLVQLDGSSMGAPQDGRSRLELRGVGSSGVVAVIDHAGTVTAAVHRRLRRGDLVTAVHNEALRSELQRSVNEVVGQRRRLVDAADTERRRLERDIHDGAQQRVLALAAALHRAAGVAQAEGHAHFVTDLEAATASARVLLDSLREVAHGIAPVMPLDKTLAPALVHLCDALPEPVQLEIGALGQLPDGVARAAYALVRDSLVDADPQLVIDVRREDASLTIRLTGRSQLPDTAVDRLSVVGGVCVETADGLTMVLPCG